MFIELVSEIKMNVFWMQQRRGILGVKPTILPNKSNGIVQQIQWNCWTNPME